MIKIAHEAPIAFMKSMKQLTDYDYALACLFDKIPGYYEYFEEALKEGRHVLLDNGVFEDGVPMDAEQYARWIEKLRPTEYIIPDEFDKKDNTIAHLENWVKNYSGLPGKTIGVCQGVNFIELNQCYHIYTQWVDKIAINFASVAYQNHDSLKNDTKLSWDAKAVYGRIAYISQLIGNEIYNQKKKHHLLGCVLPWEFNRLKTHKVGGRSLLGHFDTMDTSAPVVWGLLKGDYPDDLGSIDSKIKTKLKDLILHEPTPKECSAIIYNVAKFRYYLS